MDKKIVVAGGTGMVGSHIVVNLVKEGYSDITVISRSDKSFDKLWFMFDNNSLSYAKKSIKIKVFSLFDIDTLTEALMGCDVFYNCVAQVGFDSSNPQDLIENNVRLAHCTAESAYSAGVGKMIYISSIASLDVASYPKLTTEDVTIVTLDNKSPYSKSKFYAENEVWRVSEKGLKVVVLNPSIIIGLGDWTGNGSASMFPKVKEMPYFYTSGASGFVSATDVARMAVALSLKEEAIGERFIICSDNFSYEKFIYLLREAVDKNSKPFFYLSDFLVKLLFSVSLFIKKLGGKELLPKYVKSSLIDKNAYDGRKAERVSGLSYTSIQEEINKIGRLYLRK